MASAAVAVHEGKPGVITQSWIISRRDDLTWFIGSVLTSYLLLAANLKLGISAAILTWIWALGFDGPHVFGTVSRTYADREERKRRGRLLYGTLSLFLLGPAMVLAGRAELLGTAIWGPIFFLFASLWAYYHLVKQHYGFMVLYKKKNRDLADIDNVIDRGFLLLGMAYPLVHFIGHSVSAAERYPFLTQMLPFGWIETLTFSAFLVSLALLLLRQLYRGLRRQPINIPKLALLAAAVPMHWVVLRLLEPAPEGAFASVATLTIYHNIQYHRIVWFHNKNKYNRQPAADYGAASAINKTIWRYILFALLFGAAYHVPHYALVSPDGLAMAFIWGGAFTHYYLDSKIWRVRRDERLNENLRMESSLQSASPAS
jgi:hypothetical protein